MSGMVANWKIVKQAGTDVYEVRLEYGPELPSSANVVIFVDKDELWSLGVAIDEALS